MNFKPVLIFYALALLFSCNESSLQIETNTRYPRFEKISYFKNASGQISKFPFKSRLTYYYDNGRLYKWIELDSLGNTLTDYIVNYNKKWIQTGATYKEPGMKSYAIEQVSFLNDNTQLTEWLDSTGQVYYKMIDNLNEDGKTYRATFIGDKIHGYDSTFYMVEGFEKRIFFTNTKGKRYNDRSFEYDSVNIEGDWIVRKKIMGDTINEIQKRAVSYDDSFTDNRDKFYEGIISTGEWDESSLSFSDNEELLFFTRSKDWNKQFGFIAKKENGLFTTPQLIEELDTIYNGAISPSGNKIIYCKRQLEEEEIWLIEKSNDKWAKPKKISTDINGGYFNWFDEREIYFYTPDNNGDIAVSILSENILSNPESVAQLNTKEGTEFSPYVDKNKGFIIFTRYLEGDRTQQGFFVSYNEGSLEKPSWVIPTKINALPYGWGAQISKDGKRFYYTDGEDTYSVALESLGLKK